DWVIGRLGDWATERMSCGTRNPETGNRKPGTGNREPETENRKPKTGDEEGPETSSGCYSGLQNK
ncbi:MAG: hypothetical protein JXA39_09650, partial [Bacteroidales bacterium]|nr:hypothetical protein [Bacteroidales bacterium]